MSSDTALLIAGLGNPGTQYARNRHNAGFIVADELHAHYRFGPWRAKFEGKRKWPDPQAVADRMAEILEDPHPKLRYPVGRVAKKILLMRRFLPSRLFERLIMKNSGLDEA